MDNKKEFNSQFDAPIRPNGFLVCEKILGKPVGVNQNLRF